MAPFRGVPVIAYHKTLAYLADWLGLAPGRVRRAQAGHPAQPDPRGQAARRGPRPQGAAVIQEENYPDTTSRLVASKIPAALVRIPGGTNFQKGQSYFQYLNEVVGRIAAGLESGPG